jgi:hypothetical protein
MLPEKAAQKCRRAPVEKFGLLQLFSGVLESFPDPFFHLDLFIRAFRAKERIFHCLNSRHHSLIFFS